MRRRPECQGDRLALLQFVHQTVRWEAELRSHSRGERQKGGRLAHHKVSGL